MNVDTVTIRENISLRVVIRYLRLRAELPEFTDKLFVVNRDNQFKGVLYVSTLLTSQRLKRLATWCLTTQSSSRRWMKMTKSRWHLKNTI